MAKRKRSIGSVRSELVAKSREAALCAVRVFNDPQVSFKSETFIVLMIIAWTYLLHAYYRGRKIDYRYFRRGPKRRIFEKTKYHAFKYWELERCLNDADCPIDRDTANNLRFLITLRHEIEHQMTRSLDGYLSGRYQACALNYNEYLKKLFGQKYGMDAVLTYSIQFVRLTREQISGPEPESEVPSRLRVFIAQFDQSLSEKEYASERFSYRLLFTRQLVNRKGQADQVIEFISPESALAKEMEKTYWVKKESERPKFRAKDVVKHVKQAGFSKFRPTPEHAAMWKAENAKDPSKGYGTEIQGAWYWYQSWIDRCIELCQAAGEKYGPT
jgi:hypothetical protein